MRIFLAIALLAVTVTAHAGMIGWATSEGLPWEFIQQTGGMRVGTPMDRGGKTVLPVEYDVSGLSSITCKPVILNSGMALKKS